MQYAGHERRSDGVVERIVILSANRLSDILSMAFRREGR